MVRRLGSHLTFANCTSLLALFIAVGGSSFAAIQLGRGVVTNRNIARNAVTSPKVKNRSLLAKDFKAGELPVGAKGEKGDTGAQGPTGETGPQGLTGAPAPPPEAVRAVNPPSSPTNCDGSVKPIGEFCGLGAGSTPWDNFGSGFEPAGFYMDGSGLVHLRGGVSAGGPQVGSVHQEIFYLPSGYRPSTKRRFIALMDNAFGYVEVRPDGTVFSSDVPPTPYISLDGLYFRP